MTKAAKITALAAKIESMEFQITLELLHGAPTMDTNAKASQLRDIATGMRQAAETLGYGDAVTKAIEALEDERARAGRALLDTVAH